MGVQVTFDYPTWAQIYTQFASLTQQQVVGGALPIAELYCRNDGGGPVSSSTVQTNLLGLMVAHVCQIMYGVNGKAPAGAVGRISSATEGSVSASFDFPVNANSAWYMQTSFGAAFWQATAAYRTMRYIPSQRYGSRCYF